MEKVFCNDCIHINTDGLKAGETENYETCNTELIKAIFTTPFREQKCVSNALCKQRNIGNNCKYFKRKPL